MRRYLPLAIAILVILAVALLWWQSHRGRAPEELTLYGNVDLRQADLAFNSSERIAEVLVQEGDHVKLNQVLARLDTTRLGPQVEEAEAVAAAQQQVVDRLRNGSRPEELAQARANVVLARADAADAKAQYERVRALFEESHGRAISKMDLDQAQATAEASAARLVVNQRALDLAIAGPRVEDLRQAEAQLTANQASLALARRQLIEAELRAPSNAVVRSRILEPGELAAPQRPVLSLALIDPKWVRAYIAETDLGRIRSGTPAEISVDAFPSHRFSGFVGFISPTAEFTPKTVQTEELRSSLVYEVRIFVRDPEDHLRLGMPATVHIARSALSEPARTAAGDAR